MASDAESHGDRFRAGRLSRRDVLHRLIQVGVGASLTNRASFAQTSSDPRRIDLHHHYFASTPLLKKVMANPVFPQPIFGYAPAQSLDAMGRTGVATAFLSCPVSFGDDPLSVRQDVRALVREMNDYGAKLIADNKGRFGLFAMLPLPDVDASLREIEYVFNTLKADGVGLMTSYGSQWLGDKAFEPVFDELNRHHALVYAHPADGPCCHNLLPNTGPQTIEWNTDTSRALWSMINDGTAAAPILSRATRFADIRFVWSHAGGSLLGLVGRFLGDAATAESLARTPERNSRLSHLRRFYYDTAGSANPVQMQALKLLVGSSQIVFGSDFPFVPIVNVVRNMQTCGFTAEELRGIDRENALRMLPATTRL